MKQKLKCLEMVLSFKLIHAESANWIDELSEAEQFHLVSVVGEDQSGPISCSSIGIVMTN